MMGIASAVALRAAPTLNPSYALLTIKTIAERFKRDHDEA
jgi:hypothetical protein